MFRFAMLMLVVSLLACSVFAAPITKTFGKAPTLTEATAISKLNSEPQPFVDKDVLVTGKVVNMCQHKGCWLEIEAADSSRILCKSFGDKVTFPKDVLGQMIQLQGKLVLEKPKPAEEAPKADMKTVEAPKADIVGEVPPTSKVAEPSRAELAADEHKEHKEGEPPHACPVQKIMISIEGATVQFADKK